MKLASASEREAKWIQQLDAAKVAWAELSEDELRQSEGHTQNLVVLIQQRYAVSREEADKQIKKFFSGG